MMKERLIKLIGGNSKNHWKMESSIKGKKIERRSKIMNFCSKSNSFKNVINLMKIIL